MAQSSNSQPPAGGNGRSEFASSLAPRGALHELASIFRNNRPGAAHVPGLADYAFVGASAFALDAATALNLLSSNRFDVSGIAELGGVLHERMCDLSTQDLVAQAMVSIRTSAKEIADGTIMRGPITPPIYLYVAERVMEARGLKHKIDYLRGVFDECATLLQEFDGQRDAEGMIVARMLHLATDGYVARSLKADQAQGLKGEHTVDQAVRVLNEAVQKHPDELITGLGIFVSTPEVPVFKVPKNEDQVDLANNLLFTNRGITTQRVMLGAEQDAAKIVTSFAAGSEFLEGDNYTATHPREGSDPERTEKLLEWQRLNWFAIVHNLHPGVFGEALMVADPARGENRLMVKPEKYSPGRTGVLDESITDPLVAYALTNRFRDTRDRMPTVTISESTPRAPHGLSNPRRVVEILRNGMFPTARTRKLIGEYTKLVDKYGPFDPKASLAVIPAMSGVDALKQVRSKVSGRLTASRQGSNGSTPSPEQTQPVQVRVIAENRLPEVAGQLAHVALSFLEATYFEVYGNRAVRNNEQTANYTGVQLYVLGRMLEQGVYSNEEAVRGLHVRMNDLLIEVLTSRPGVMSEQVTEIARFVYETCLPNYPQDAQRDFLKKFVSRGLADRSVFDRWEEITRPLMVREQQFVPERGERFGVRPAIARDVLELTRVLFNAMPDLQDKPAHLIDMLLKGDDDFVLQALRVAWVVGNRLQLKGFRVGPDTKRLAELNEPVRNLTEDAKRRLEYEIARRLRIDAPLCIRQDMDSLVSITQTLSGDMLEGQQQFLEGFARMTPLFENDFIAIDARNHRVTALTLPQGIPGMEEGGMLELSTGAEAKTLAFALNNLVNEEGGEIPQLMASLEGRAEAPEVADAIMDRATTRASTRDGLLMSQATSFFEGAFGVPNAQEGETAQARRTRRMDGFISNIWFPHGGYGRSLGILAALTAHNQALGKGVEGVRDLVQSLLAAEAQEKVQAIELARETGVVTAAKSVSDIAVALNTMALQRLNSVKDAQEMGDAVRNSAFARARQQLERIGQLQTRLAELKGTYGEEELAIAEERLALRRTQIEEAAKFARAEFRRILAQMYQEKEGMVTRMLALRQKAQANQMQVVQWIQSVVDDEGDANQLRFQLMKILREQTGTDEWWIPAPSAQMLQSFTGMAPAPAGEVDRSRGTRS